MAGARGAVEVRCEHRQGRGAARQLRALAGRYLASLRLGAADLSIVVTSDARIRRLNRQWRGHDEATDVLSFPAGEVPRARGARRSLGDVVISLDTARRRARERRSPVGDELALYLAHGLLHLVGHDHHRETDAARMARAEARLLGTAGLVALAREAARERQGSGKAGPGSRQ